MQRILIDAREFVAGRRSGIGRVLEGLVDALAESDDIKQIVLAVSSANDVPLTLRNRQRIKTREIPSPFLKSEKALSGLSKYGFSLYISPYRKLPLFGCHCRAVHTIHDVLDLTHPAYKRRIKVLFDTFRLKKALERAVLTWYDSSWSMKATERLAGCAGNNPRVRYLGIDERFNNAVRDKSKVLKKYNLQPGYILVVGNGLPHKNLDVVLRISDNVPRQLVFVGVSTKNQEYWNMRYPGAKADWINHVEDEDLCSVIGGAFCLFQPSTAEGYGYPPLEAMACGVPAVVSNIPVLIETTGGHALSADPDDPRQWLQACEALDDEDTYRIQSEKGLTWVEPFRGRKGWGKHVSDIENLTAS